MKNTLIGGSVKPLNDKRSALSKIKKAYKLIRGIIYDDDLSVDDLIKVEKARDNLKEVIENHKGDEIKCSN